VIRSYKDIPYTTNILKDFNCNSGKSPFQYVNNRQNRSEILSKIGTTTIVSDKLYCEFDDGLFVYLDEPTKTLSISFDFGKNWVVDVLRGVFVVSFKRFGKESFFIEHVGQGSGICISKTIDLFKTLIPLINHNSQILPTKNVNISQLSNLYVSRTGHIVTPDGIFHWIGGGESTLVKSVDISETRSIFVYLTDSNIIKVVDSNDVEIIYQYNTTTQPFENLSVVYYASKNLILIYNRDSVNRKVVWFNILTRTFGLLNDSLFALGDSTTKYDLFYIDNKLFVMYVGLDGRLCYRQIYIDDVGGIGVVIDKDFVTNPNSVVESYLTNLNSPEYSVMDKYIIQTLYDDSHISLSFGNTYNIISDNRIYSISFNDRLFFDTILYGYNYKTTINVKDYLEMNVNKTCITLNTSSLDQSGVGHVLSTVLSGDNLENKSMSAIVTENYSQKHYKFRPDCISPVNEYLRSFTSYFYDAGNDVEIFAMNSGDNFKIITIDVDHAIINTRTIGIKLNPSAYFVVNNRHYVISFDDMDDLTTNVYSKNSYSNIYDITESDNIFKVTTIPLENSFDEYILSSSIDANIPFNRSKKVDVSIINEVVYIISDAGVYMYNSDMNFMGKLEIPNLKGIVTRVDYLNGSYFITVRRSDIRKSIGLKVKDSFSNVMTDDYVYYGKNFNSLKRIDLDTEYIADIKCDVFRNKVYIVHVSNKFEIYNFDGNNLVKFREMLSEGDIRAESSGELVSNSLGIIHEVSSASNSTVTHLKSMDNSISSLSILKSKLDVGDYTLYVFLHNKKYILLKESKSGYFEMIQNSNFLRFKYVNVDNNSDNVRLDLVDCGKFGKFIVAMSNYYSECINLTPIISISQYTNARFNISQDPKVVMVRADSGPSIIYKDNFDIKIFTLGKDDDMILPVQSHYNLNDIIFPKESISWFDDGYAIPYLDRIVQFKWTDSLNRVAISNTINSVYGSESILPHNADISIVQLKQYCGVLYGSFTTPTGSIGTKLNFIGVLKKSNSNTFDVYIIKDTLRVSLDNNGPYGYFLDIIDGALCVCDSNNNTFTINTTLVNSDNMLIINNIFRMFCDSDTMDNSSKRVISSGNTISDKSIFIRNFFNDFLLKVDLGGEYSSIIDEATGRKCIQLKSSTPTQMDRVTIGDYDIIYSVKFSKFIDDMLSSFGQEGIVYTHIYDR